MEVEKTPFEEVDRHLNCNLFRDPSEIRHSTIWYRCVEEMRGLGMFESSRHAWASIPRPRCRLVLSGFSCTILAILAQLGLAHHWARSSTQRQYQQSTPFTNPWKLSVPGGKPSRLIDQTLSVYPHFVIRRRLWAFMHQPCWLYPVLFAFARIWTSLRLWTGIVSTSIVPQLRSIRASLLDCLDLVIFYQSCMYFSLSRSTFMIGFVESIIGKLSLAAMRTLPGAFNCFKDVSFQWPLLR